MLPALILFAQEVAQDVAKDGGGPPQWTSMLPIFILMGAFFLLVILPAQRKEKKQREAIMTTLKKNDEVLTASGIIGVVQNLREGEDEVTIKIDENCKVRMRKTSIVQILKAKDETPAK
jgi:preprotein translocase subunit YajC